MGEKEQQLVDRAFLFYFILYIIFFIYILIKWHKSEPYVFVTPEGQEEVEPQPESGPFQ